LDHPQLRELFLQFDEPANREKRRGRLAGFAAIALGFMALSLAALEYPLLHQAGEHPYFLRTGLAATSALCGIAGALIGGVGVLFAGRKRRWLRLRLMGELTRLLHFQTLACRLHELLISTADETAKSSYISQRQIWLDAFRLRYVGKLDAALAEMLAKDNLGMEWLHDCKPPSEVHKSTHLTSLFDAYRELRILHQIGYANYKLQDDRKIFSSVPGRQADVLAQISLIAIVILCAIDLGVLIDAFFPGAIWTAFTSQFINLLIIWIALAALAIRAMEQGLQPDREFERYHHYRSAVRAVLDRFDRAESPADKIRVMEDMERLAFDELRDFLVTNDRSHFVL
jgi:hypothetical protein